MIKILVIGELCVDRFIYGVVDNLCPEAPVPIINPVETKENRGMAGNVVENLKVLHDDIEVLHWHQSDTIVKTRYVDKKTNQMLLRVDEEKTTNTPLIFLTAEQRKTISESDIVIISDYKKGYLSNPSIKAISELSNFIILDSKRILNWDTIQPIDFVKLNTVEYNNNKELVDKHPDKVLITRGGNGVDHNGVNYPSPNPQETIDVSGAGDTFTASFALKYFITKDIEQSINFANEVCSNVVNKKGVSLPDNKFKLT
jgi:D-beta-D-heptose 7-phosphate kinase/D-beta-D-heptose 1-phosphate adenosyltransferase